MASLDPTIPLVEDTSTNSSSVIPIAPPHLARLRPCSLVDSVQSLLDIDSTSPGRGASVSKVKQNSSVIDLSDPTPNTFGSRLLTDPSRVDDFNAWDHVEWDESHLSQAAEKIAFQSANPVPLSDQPQYDDSVASNHWDKFYQQHEEGFFKDRKWINLEFPELIACTESNAGPKVIADLGCAVGNTVYPLLRINKNPNLKIHALDFSAEAISILRQNPEYDANVVDADVWDMANPHGPPLAIPQHSVDVIVLIFAFSALSPKQWPIAVENLSKLLKPDGTLLLRDYGRYDLTQLRLKANRLLSDSFYIRGDGTRVYYFTNEEIDHLFSKGWTIEQNAIDKRLLVNRKEGKKMYRAWVQLKARKIDRGILSSSNSIMDA